VERNFKEIDSFRKEVFRYVHYLDSLNKTVQNIREDSSNDRGGCLGVIMGQFATFMIRKSRDHYREAYQMTKHERRAIGVLQDAEIKWKLCELLTESDVLPIDVAHKITPMLYDVATTDPARVPKEPIMFAVIARKIAKDGATKYCKG
jgi:hypothetical protein